MNSYDDEFNDNRLQLLKQATILNYFDELALDNIETRNLELLDSLLEHLYNGDLDFCFQSKYLLGTDDEEKEEIFKLARKYVNLCFYDGKPQFWLDSVDGVTLGGENPDFVCMKILDNYDFLLGLINAGGEYAVKLLESFNNKEVFNNTTLVDNIRNRFSDDDLLRDILIMAADKEGEYKEYNGEQLAIMFAYPIGILYEEKNDGSKNKVNVESLNNKLMKCFDINSTYDYINLLNNIPIDEFEEVIFKIYYDSKNSHKVKKYK